MFGHFHQHIAKGKIDADIAAVKGWVRSIHHK
jgi:uncharacterized protein YkwD